MICPKCETEYDLKVVGVESWRRHEAADIKCEVCHSVLSHQDAAHYGILIMTKRGEIADV